MGQYVKFFLVLGVIYMMFAGAFTAFRHQFLYFFVEVGAPPADMPRTQVKYIPETFEDPRLEVWITEPLPRKPVILYFMGSSGALSVHEPRLREFASRGFGIAAMAYRGGGGQPGTPSEAALTQDAARLYAELDTLFGREIPASDRAIYGYALGSALAVNLAAKEDEMALILESPFGSMCEMMQKLVVILPACKLMWDERYDSQALIDQVDTTVLFLHGAKDTIVPLDMGAALYEAAVEPKFNKIYRQGGHIDLARFGATEDIAQFLNTLRGGT